MKKALLVIDVQNEYFTGLLKVSYPIGSIDNIARAMDTASTAGIPIVVIQHSATMIGSPVFQKGSLGWELHPEVKNRPCNLVLGKELPGSFTNTALETVLRERQIETVVICGYMTQMCCDTTARQAFHMGFGVEFLSDATGTLDIKNEAGSVTAEELHRAVLVTQHARFSKVMTTDRWIQSASGR